MSPERDLCMITKRYRGACAVGISNPWRMPFEPPNCAHIATCFAFQFKTLSGTWSDSLANVRATRRPPRLPGPVPPALTIRASGALAKLELAHTIVFNFASCLQTIGAPITLRRVAMAPQRILCDAKELSSLDMLKQRPVYVIWEGMHEGCHVMFGGGACEAQTSCTIGSIAACFS